MNDMPKNPFNPVEIERESMVKLKAKEGESDKMVEAKHYHVMYVVGEGEDKRFVDSGSDQVDEMKERTVFVAPSVHKTTGDPFHYDMSAVERLSGVETLNGGIKHLNRAGQCNDHPVVEVSFQGAGIECCAMSKEDADKRQVPVQYVSGYLLGRGEGLMKVAQIKTVLETGTEYYENIHVIPESIVREWSCLE